MNTVVLKQRVSMVSLGYKSSRHALFELDVTVRGGLNQGGSDAEKRIRRGHVPWMRVEEEICSKTS
jgi:hypothetical protein